MRHAVRQVLGLARIDLARTLADRPAALWMLVLPLFLMWFFGQMQTEPSGLPKVSLAVADEDSGWLARAFVAELEADHIELRQLPAGAAEGEDEGEVPVRLLRIPPGFTAGVEAGEQQTLRLERRSDADAEFSMAAEVQVLRTIVRTLGRLVEIGGEGPSAQAGEGAAARFTELAGREPLVRLEASVAGEGRPVPSGRAQSVPGILTMMVLMNSLIYGGVFLTSEKQEGMLRRQVTLPVGRFGLFAGKLAGRVLIVGVQTALLLAAGHFVMGVSYGRSPAGLLLLAGSFTLLVASLSTLLGAVLSTPEQASAVGWLSSMVLAALGGCWWPSEVVPRWLWQAAHLLPTPWAMDGFHALISFGRGLDGVLVPSAALLGFTALFSALGARFLRPG